MVQQRPPEGAQSVGRALKLLKAFSKRTPELRLAELCERVSLTRTTAHRLLAALESEGLVSRDSSTGSYRLGPAAIALGALALQSNDLRSVVQPELEKLAAETGETATLEVLADGRTLILSEVSGDHLVTVSAEIGTLWPLHATSTGKALLADMPPKERRQLLQPPMRRYTDLTITDVEEMEQQLLIVRACGFAVAIEELEVGAVAVATSIRDTSGLTVGAISLGGPASRLDRSRLETFGEKLTAVAERLSSSVARSL